jgi:adenylate cyclase
MVKDQIERRLAAIMFIDVVGYSRLMGEDDEATLLALQSHRFSVIDSTIGQHYGRIVKSVGDGVLVEFASVHDAVECAVLIQGGVISKNAKVPEEKQLRFRIGIQLGDVIIEGSDIFGDGVNIASRLQEIAEPDGVCISATVFEYIDGTTDYVFTDIGAHELKNIKKPLRLYHHNPGASKRPALAAFRPFIDMPGEISKHITGGCLCGKIRYEASEMALGSMYCHCRMCQRFTGAPVSGGTTFLTDTFHIINGEPKFYQSSKIARRGFCGDCGSSLIYQGVIGVWTKWVMINTASLDEPKKFPPTYHLGIESKMPWLELHDDLPKTMCKDSPSLIDAYSSVGQDVP